MHKAILFLLALFGALFAAENFDQCLSADEDGTYVLTRDIEYGGSGSCIKITANRVTIDCAGHSITGNYEATGVRIKEGVTETLLRDCAINYFRYGVYAEENTRDITIEGAEMDSCDEGIVLEEGNNADITNPSFTNVDIGLRLDNWYGGELSNGFFSTRDYGVYITSSGSYAIHASEFTNSMRGVYTEGICSGIAVSDSTFHSMVTPVELYGSSAHISGSTFYNNAGYAIVVREAMNTFEEIRIHSQPLFISTQSSSFTILDFTIGTANTAGSIHFDSFALRKPYTTTKYYDYNSTNMKITPDFASIVPPEYAEPDMKGVTVWLADPGFEAPALFTSDAKSYTTRSTILMEGQMVANAPLVSNAEGVLEFTLPVFEGAYTIGEMPPEPEPEKVITSISITAPSEAEINSPIEVEAKDQEGDPIPAASVYYYHDFSEALLAGYTGSDGKLSITIPEEGAFIIQVNYKGITSQRAISVSAPEPPPEPAPEPEEPAPAPAPEPGPESGQPQSDLISLLPLAAGIFLLLLIIAAAAWFLFLRKPGIPHHKQTLKDKLKRFRRKPGD